MTTTTTDHPPRFTAAWWLRLGQALLFVGLLVVATALAWIGGAGWPVPALAGMMLVAFVAGLSLQPRLGILGRSLWVGVLFLGSVTSMIVSREFLWVVFPLWLLAGSVLPLLASLLLTAATLAVIVPVVAITDGQSVGGVLGPLVGALGGGGPLPRCAPVRTRGLRAQTAAGRGAPG